MGIQTWFKVVVVHSYFPTSTFVVQAEDRNEASMAGMFLWRTDHPQFESVIPSVQSCNPIDPSKSIFLIEYEYDGLVRTKAKVIIVDAIDEEDAVDEALAELYKTIGPGYNNISTGKRVIPTLQKITKL